MITRLRAKVIAKGNDFLIADVNGIGLKVRVPAPLLDTVNSLGKEVNLFTHLRLAENGREIEAMLFGFGSPDDLALFELLLSVSGIGPKVALAVLSAAPADTLRAAIMQGNAQALTQFPGIGKKTAERIVMELKGKVSIADAGELLAISANDAEALAALTALGYSIMEAQRALANGAEATSVEDKVLNALRYLGAA
ncbi:MAG: Holliday junction branch migration protein RuvA [Chloroflexi bacterium]|jgi:Holliday junction DNA helicase RuvA|nr:MAG: Holliday junction branch migration protein RuvA [Chloroflexota bacterium]